MKDETKKPSAAQKGTTGIEGRSQGGPSAPRLGGRAQGKGPTWREKAGLAATVRKSVTDTGIFSLESMIIDQGKVLSRIEAHQEHQTKGLETLEAALNDVARTQSNCPARIQSLANEATVRIQRPEKRPSLGPLPLPKTTEIIKLLPWAIAAGMGIASAMGWIPPVGTP